MKLRLLPKVCLIAPIVYSQVLLAQTVPDAGALLQRIEHARDLAQPRQVLPDTRGLPVETKAMSGVSVTVKEFRFVGNTRISHEALTEALAPFLNRPLDFTQLREAAALIATVYREAGWIVRTYLPKQDITEGIVTINIVESIYGGAKVEGDEPRLLKLSSVLSVIDAQQKEGEHLNTQAIDRGLMLADDLPGVVVSGALREGAEEGQTELVLRFADEPPVTGEVEISNTGARSTGDLQGVATLNINSPLGIGDQVNINTLNSQGSDYVRFAYTAPVGNDGFRLGINSSQLNYRLIVPEFAALKGYGQSETMGVTASYPMVRARDKNLYLGLGYDSKRFTNYLQHQTQSNYGVDVWNVSLSGNLFDGIGGGGANSASVSWVTGNVNQGELNTGENRKLGGGFEKYRYSLSRQQTLTNTLSFFTAFSGQYAAQSLDSSERFFLGGPSGVRAYPVNEGSGSIGQLATAELRWRLPDSLVLTGFYDWGRVSNYGISPDYQLKGYGLSLEWLTANGLSLRTIWARRDGKNPNPTSTGNDQDGSLIQDRLWLIAKLPF